MGRCTRERALAALHAGRGHRNGRINRAGAMARSALAGPVGGPRAAEACLHCPQPGPLQQGKQDHCEAIAADACHTERQPGHGGGAAQAP